VTSNYEKIIKGNLSKLFSQPPSRLHRSLGAEKSGESLLLRAFGQDCSIDHEKVTLSRSEVVDPKGLIVSLYALHANPEQLQLEPFKSFKDFPGSMPYQGAFSANSERVLVPHVPLIKKGKRISKRFLTERMAMTETSLLSSTLFLKLPFTTSSICLTRIFPHPSHLFFVPMPCLLCPLTD